MKTLRMVFLFILLLTVSACNFLTTSDSSEKVEAEKETVDKSSEETTKEVLFQEGTYKWEKDGEILGGLDITDPKADSFTFMLQAYDGENIGELSGIAQVNGEMASFTHAENAECKVSFGWKEDRLTIDTSEVCESLNESQVSFTGVYTKIEVGTSASPTEENVEAEAEEASWQEALYIDPAFDRGNLSISNVTNDSFQFTIDVSSGGNDGELKGTATINGNEATFQDTEDPACSGTFIQSNDVVTFIEDSCLNYHDAAVGFNGDYTMTDQEPAEAAETASCEKAPFHSDLLQFAEQGHLKDASIFLGMSEEALKKLKPSMTYDEAFYEGTPGFYDDNYAYLTANDKVSDLRYNALSEGPAIPYTEVVCQFGEPDEVVFNELDSEYLHVYHAGENKLSFVSDSKEGAIKAVVLQPMTVQ
ncbi:hypothetical protein [Bacillus sp. N1-1]|jgi:hypothetical protein|uniref:hypothetical protein n=1 Tax=Bacillus sp. N1-1 TaxID=2682541 RepID=UPI001315F0A6|nr:hypothetical protein [Bacillus sp. N1-1]QHA91328.1 hypothetical protein GNK04_07780 [Bacillus sp. N1-1]